MSLNNFILNCEKENKELEKNLNYFKNRSERLQQKIDKAIEYIEKDTQYDEEHKYYDVDVDDILNVLSILKGKDVK